MTLDKAIKIIEIILSTCGESQSRNGTIFYDVGGIESREYNFKEALELVLDNLNYLLDKSYQN